MIREIRASVDNYMGKVLGFFKDVYGEMQKVVWPTRAQTVRYTVAVIGLSVAVALILGAADYGLLKLFEKLVNK